eukprot:TRINITY_DN14587_c0_g1_i1.p1 TRINITY_DN14587_c0_g1~~TRINITY_DN14587_c0_g1_i1.p1  ORF type:complete len:297 (+),score=68.78 TRINITY_DN14587_c0_g1_i1:31-891(+)
MDPVVLAIVAVALALFAAAAVLLRPRTAPTETVVPPHRGRPQAHTGHNDMLALRGGRAALTNAERLAAATAAELDEDGEEEAEGSMQGGQPRTLSSRMARISAKKAEKKAQKEQRKRAQEWRNAEQARIRDEREAREAEEEEELEELAREQAERQKAAREARKKAAEDEYRKWATQISVEEAGEEEGEDEEVQNLLTSFIEHITTTKICVLQEVAAKFQLSVERTIQLIKDLEKAGQLTGAFDDRGKYIHVTRDEMLKLGGFVKLRGRVSITELTREANRILQASL